MASSGLADVWTIMAMSTSSNAPSLMNSCLPERNLIVPSRRRFRRYSHIHELLGGDGHQLDVATERTEDVRYREADGSANHDADLGVVTAGVGGSGHRIGGPVAGQRQSVELPQNCCRRAVVSTPQTRGDAGDCHILGVLDAELGEFLANETGSLVLPEPQLRSAEGLLGDIGDPITPPIYGDLGSGLQRLRTGHSVNVSSE